MHRRSWFPPAPLHTATAALPAAGVRPRLLACLERLAPWLAGLAALLLYARSAAPGIVTFFDDSLEFQLVAPTFAIAHPTGYPLYLLLGGLWTRLLPVGTWAGRMNLFSAAAAAAAVGLLYGVAARLAAGREGRPNPWAGLAAALAFGLGPVWGSQATVAEVYALHNLLLVWLLAAALGTDRLDAAARPRRLRLVALLSGLALAHHRTSLLALPVIALYLVWSMPALLRPQRAWIGYLAALLAPLLLYLYLPVAAALGAADLHGSYRNTWAGFWEHVLGAGYTTFLATNPLDAGYTTADWLAWLQAQLGWSGLVPAVLGLAWLVERPVSSAPRPARAWVCVALLGLVNGLFVLRYRVADPEVFALPVLMSLAIFVGGGVGLAGRLLPGLPGGLVQAALVAAVALGLGGRGPWVDRHTDWAAHDRARLMAATPFPPGSIVIGIEGEVTALRYMQLAEGAGTNATPQAADDPGQRQAALAEAVAAGHPVYLTRELAGIEPLYSFGGEAALVRVWPRGAAPSTPPQGEAAALAGGRLLLAADPARFSPVTTQPTALLALDWQVQAPLEQVLKVSLRLLDAGGAPLHWPDGRPAVEDRFPLHQVAATPAWPVGVWVRDVHAVAVPPAQAAALARVLVVVYDSADAQEVGRVEIPVAR